MTDLEPVRDGVYTSGDKHASLITGGVVIDWSNLNKRWNKPPVFTLCGQIGPVTKQADFRILCK